MSEVMDYEIGEIVGNFVLLLLHFLNNIHLEWGNQAEAIIKGQAYLNIYCAPI